MSETKTTTKKTNVECENPISANYYEEEVPVTLFKDNNLYKDDVFVSVNGENCLIKRGGTVMVKRKFAMALENSAMQDMIAIQLIENSRSINGGDI